MENLIVILARKNSKRLKNKNLLKIKRQSLIEICIDFAKMVVGFTGMPLSRSLSSHCQMETSDFYARLPVMEHHISLESVFVCCQMLGKMVRSVTKTAMSASKSQEIIDCSLLLPSSVPQKTQHCPPTT